MDKIRRDKYKSARGGSTHILQLACAKCDHKLFEYQKDGPGNLFRLYLDRIIDKNDTLNINSIQEKSEMKPLLCSKCGVILALPMMYNPEKRLAYRLIRGAVHSQK